MSEYHANFVPLKGWSGPFYTGVWPYSCLLDRLGFRGSALAAHEWSQCRSIVCRCDPICSRAEVSVRSIGGYVSHRAISFCPAMRLSRSLWTPLCAGLAILSLGIRPGCTLPAIRTLAICKGDGRCAVTINLHANISFSANSVHLASYVWCGSMGPYAGQRVGEAKVPGPALQQSQQSDISTFFGMQPSLSSVTAPPPRVNEESHIFRLAVANPTSILHKGPECAQLAADLVLLSETSAVVRTQAIMKHQLRSHGLLVVWGDPVAPHETTRDGPASLRGHASGVAIPCTGEVHRPVPQIPAAMLATTGLVEAMVRFGPIEMRVIALYGWPRNSRDHKDRNQALLEMALQRVQTSGVPTLLGGDLNADVTELPVWEQFRTLTYVEAFTFASDRLQVSLPPTCKGSTRHDTFLIPSFLQPLVCKAEVLDTDHLFDAHSPMVLTCALPHAYPARLQWNLPQSWVQFEPDRHDIQSAYTGSSPR